MQADRGEIVRLTLALLLPALLSGCSSSRAVLVNDKGEYTSCASDSVGLIGAMVAHDRFESCLADAKARGYRVERQE